MTIETSTTALRDITLLFDKVDKTKVDTRKLKTLFAMQPVVMDTPELSVIVYPPLQLILQIDDRRIRITHQQHSDKIDAVSLWDTAHTCRKLVSSSRLIAYGFNYDIVSEVSSEAFTAVVNRWFLTKRELLGNLLGGDIVTFTPHLRFEKDEVLYDLIIEEEAPGILKAHLNVHFESSRLPPSANLKTSFIAEYEKFRKLMHGLFDN